MNDSIQQIMECGAVTQDVRSRISLSRFSECFLSTSLAIYEAISVYQPKLDEHGDMDYHKIFSLVLKIDLRAKQFSYTVGVKYYQDPAVEEVIRLEDMETDPVEWLEAMANTDLGNSEVQPDLTWFFEDIEENRSRFEDLIDSVRHLQKCLGKTDQEVLDGHHEKDKETDIPF